MYNNNNARFPIGDNGDELELIKLLSLGYNPTKNSCNAPGYPCKPNNDNNSCDDSCSAPELGEECALAMVYSPDHKFSGLYEHETALERGTLFKGLDKPFGGMTVSGGFCK